LTEDGVIDQSTEVSVFIEEKSSSDGLYGWFDFVLLCECADLQPSTTAPCEPSVVLVEEDFEAEEDENSWHEGSEFSWSGGITTESAGFGHFLGRLGQGNDAVSQNFLIATSGGLPADSVSLEFYLYQIDNWNSPDDSFTVSVGGTPISLGDMSLISEGQYLDGVSNGISWSRTTTVAGKNLGFMPDNDAKHLVQLEIPASAFPSGTLEIAFQVVTSSDIDQQSAGVDDFKLTGHYSCDSRRQLDDSQLHNDPATHFRMSNLHAEKDQLQGSYGTSKNQNAGARTDTVDSLDEEDSNGPHCGAIDFPCDSGRKVYICHYSVFKGYNTYCVAEEDTDVIRFYPNDYCGPCVGGYGGKKPQGSS